MLKIKNLHAKVGDNEILKGLNLDVKPGEIHAIMGPNGSGKSTLAAVLAGREAYEVTDGMVELDGTDLLDLEASDRAREGVFLAFQYPIEIPGVSNLNFMKAAVNAKRAHQGQPPIKAKDFLAKVKECSSLVELDGRLSERSVNEGFSGGEKKRNEIFQMAILEPKLCILDETDSGLDIDALRVVSKGVNAMRSPDRFKSTLPPPTRKSERWKYSPIAKLLNSTLSTDSSEIDSGFSNDIPPNPVAGLEAYRLVFRNGTFNSSLSDLPVAKGVICMPLSEVSAEDAPEFKNTYSKTEWVGELNESYQQDGMFLKIARNIKLDRPVLIHHLTDGPDARQEYPGQKMPVPKPARAELVAL